MAVFHSAELAAADGGDRNGHCHRCGHGKRRHHLLKGDLRGIEKAIRLSRANDEQHPLEPLLRIHLQLAGRADRCQDSLRLLRHPAQPDNRRRIDESEFSLDDRQCVTAALTATLSRYRI